MKEQIWKVEAQGDTVYIAAITKQDAQGILDRNFGAIPPKLVTWTPIEEVPEGEEAIR